jgi:small G protein signaling modulator 3
MSSEEEAFWCFVQIIEVIMPLDYYTNLQGVMVDTQAFKVMMKDTLPKLSAHLQQFNFDIDILLTKWLIQIFVNHLPLNAELAVWDLFMIKGMSVVFRVALTLFKTMEEQILKAKDTGDIFMIVSEYQTKITCEILLEKFFNGINNRDI